MKHSYLISIPLTLLLVATSAQAEPGDRGHHRPDMEKRIERMTEELDLTTEQSEQLLAVMQASAAERAALREKYAAQIKPEMCALHLATMEQVREILSAEQAAEMESKLEHRASAEAPDGGWRHGKKGNPLKDCEPQG